MHIGRYSFGRAAVQTMTVLLWTAAAFGQQPAADSEPEPPIPAILQNYTPVSDARLKNPEDANWPMIRRTYDGWGYSPLAQLTASNVKRLRPAWVFSTGMTSGHEAAPLVNNGVMFVVTPGGQVIAIDATSGLLLWRYQRRTPTGTIQPHQTSRGLALHGDKVYFAAGDAVLIALDAKTGKEVWTAKVADNTLGYYMTLAPLVAGGKVMVGASGGELGIRGFVAAYDPETGSEQWKAYTVPAPGEPGSETWPSGDQWMNGGGSVWVTGNYDAEANIAYWGVGNGGPWMGDQRPGDNLYVSSTIGIDVATGQIKSYFQYDPNESWDWDEVSPPLLIDYKRNGNTVKGLVDVARDGYLWFIDRGTVDNNRKMKFIEGTPYVRQNVYKRLDPTTGRPEVDPDHKPATDKTVDFCPSLWGGKNWPPIAFSPKTRMIYIPANENLCMAFTARKIEYMPGAQYTGTRNTLSVVPGADHIGEVQAWNVDTGKRMWTHKYATSQNWGPMLATAGGLVFSGGTNDRKFHAFDAASGKLLWEFPTNSGITGQPVSFLVNGKQYIAVMSGWGVDPRGLQARLNQLFPGKYPEVPEGGAIWVFALE
jgi:alcohol dehydrogenase (cytochrome c)